MNRTVKACPRSGFTLVELLVAMTISLVVLAAVFTVFDNSQRSYVVQEGVAEAQQNVRTAKLFLERDLRMAGAGIPDFSFGGETLYPIEFENNVDGTSGTAATLPNIVIGSDLVRVRYQNFGVGSCGADPGGSLPPCDMLPQLTLAGEMPPSATVADVNEDIQAGIGWDGSCYCAGTQFIQPSPGMPFIITVPDGSRSAVLFHTETLPNSDRIGSHPNFTFQGKTYLNKLLNTFPAGSLINFFHPDGIYDALYYLENRGGIPCLMRDTGHGGQVIAEYIEDLQLAFELDTDDDGVVDTTINDADLTDLQKPRVRVVRLGLVARSAHDQRDFRGQRPALEDHAAGSTDHFRRRRLSVTIRTRNLGL